MKGFLLFCNIFFGIYWLGAQVTFQAVPQKKEVILNEPIHVQFILSIKSKSSANSVSTIKLPNFSNSQVVARNVIQKQGYENDEMILLYGEEITLRAIKPGSIKIGAASVTVNGKTYTSKPLSISVQEERTDIQEDRINMLGMGDAFLAFKVSDRNPFQNEGITGKLKFYTKKVDLINSLSNLSPPNFQGLFVQPIKERNNTYEQEIINGEAYLSRVIGSYVIFPSKPGTLTIYPFTLTLTVAEGFFDEQEIYIKSAPVTLQVKKIPDNAPEGFYGVVGNYKIKAHSNKESLNLSEAATVTVEITGKGNIGLLKSPELIIPKNIEQYSPKNKMETLPGTDGVVGKIVMSTVLVPQKSGSFSIKVKPFTFFDPKEEQFKTISAEPVVFKVREDTLKNVKSDSIETNIKSRDSGKLKSYIPDLHVKETISEVLEGKPVKTEKSAVLLIVAGVVLLSGFLFFILYKKKKRIKKNVNTVNEIDKTSVHKINKLSPPPSDKKNFEAELFQLKKIAEKGDDKKAFYSLAESIIQAAIYQNLGIEQQQFITSVDIEEKLINKFGDEFAEECKNLLLKSQIEQYSNLTDQDSLHSVYLKIEDLIKKLN
ncbi:BatD family protein [Apibacter sp. HY039]|uniref:BatD family protein n=1 Tax=Apibacter sp. HY039 TaxID=2501476 RepID=UPI000FEB8D1F|nr:BatD family protein [Apibacter sp. HY039]